ncbi:MAG: GNAT family N-acetyltransferase [Pseudomonadales bacterium]|nr:GNAT family N-acetyltransferase [Pseudomonadales bacterium]
MQLLKMVPWDTAVFGVDCYELSDYDDESLRLATATPGHFTVRVPPLADRSALFENGFYFADSLITPYCSKDQFKPYSHTMISVTRDVDLGAVLEIAKGAFLHGRFHKDPYINDDDAETRYANWIRQLHQEGAIYGLLYDRQPGGFIAVKDNCLVLHAVHKRYRGKGLAKYFWTPVCKQLFAEGFDFITSSISATNLPVVNLYISLGFRMQTSLDIYHLLNSDK